jgi:hypothetical protein
VRSLPLLLLALPACGVSPAQPPPEPIPVPFVVSDFYSPDGFFGDGETRGSVDLIKSCPSRPPGAAGDCYTITYRPGIKRYAGIFWQHPHNNWGDRPGHRIAPGATRLTLQARGPAGQAITVGGGQMDSKPLGDSFKLEEVTVALTPAWTAHEVPFRGASYDGPNGVIGAFQFNVKAGDGDEPITFYLDDLRWTP